MTQSVAKPSAPSVVRTIAIALVSMVIFMVVAVTFISRITRKSWIPSSFGAVAVKDATHDGVDDVLSVFRYTVSPGGMSEDQLAVIDGQSGELRVSGPHRSFDALAVGSSIVYATRAYFVKSVPITAGLYLYDMITGRIVTSRSLPSEVGRLCRIDGDLCRSGRQHLDCRRGPWCHRTWNRGSPALRAVGVLRSISGCAKTPRQENSRS